MLYYDRVGETRAGVFTFYFSFFLFFFLEFFLNRAGQNRAPRGSNSLRCPPDRIKEAAAAAAASASPGPIVKRVWRHRFIVTARVRVLLLHLLLLARSTRREFIPPSTTSCHFSRPRTEFSRPSRRSKAVIFRLCPSHTYNAAIWIDVRSDVSADLRMRREIRTQI